MVILDNCVVPKENLLGSIGQVKYHYSIDYIDTKKILDATVSIYVFSSVLCSLSFSGCCYQ